MRGQGEGGLSATTKVHPVRYFLQDGVNTVRYLLSNGVKVYSPEMVNIAQGQGFHDLEASAAARVKGECVSGMPGSESVAGNPTVHIGTWENHIAPYRSFQQAEEARRLAEHTPKHSSWLDMAEIELGIMGRQCLSRRIDNIEELRQQAKTWGNSRNGAKAKVNWQFTTADARIKLRRLYPSIEE